MERLAENRFVGKMDEANVHFFQHILDTSGRFSSNFLFENVPEIGFNFAKKEIIWFK